MYEYEALLPEGQSRGGKRLTEEPSIHPSSAIIRSRLGGWTDIGPRVSIAESEVGDYTYFAGDASAIYAAIGKFCSIASHVRINPSNHPMWRVTQHHATYRRVQYGLDRQDDEEFFNWRKASPVRIGHDVWLGHGVIVMPGVSIGTGAAVGSGAVVTKDLPPYAVAVGVPAKVIKYRFDGETVEKLLKSAWWDWDRATLERKFHELLDKDVFLQHNLNVQEGGSTR